MIIVWLFAGLKVITLFLQLHRCLTLSPFSFLLFYCPCFFAVTVLQVCHRPLPTVCSSDLWRCETEQLHHHVCVCLLQSSSKEPVCLISPSHTHTARMPEELSWPLKGWEWDWGRKSEQKQRMGFFSLFLDGILGKSSFCVTVVHTIDSLLEILYPRWLPIYSVQFH